MAMPEETYSIRNRAPCTAANFISRRAAPSSSFADTSAYRFWGGRRSGSGNSSVSILNVVILAVVQGLAELLPVSSSAHVVVTEKLLGLDPSSPPMTLLLVMLHTGTMFSVIVYFWTQWRVTFSHSMAAFKKFAVLIILATLLTG